MPDREKVIKAYEDFVNGYECFCTSDDYEYEMHKAVLALLKEQEAVVHCGDCENFCFDNISPNVGRCMLTNMSHSKTWFCAHGKREEGR